MRCDVSEVLLLVFEKFVPKLTTNLSKNFELGTGEYDGLLGTSFRVHNVSILWSPVDTSNANNSYQKSKTID